MSDTTDRLNKRILTLEERLKESEHELELRVHTLQTHLQGVLADAESIVYSFTREQIPGTNAIQQDAKELVHKILLLQLNTNILKPSLGTYSLGYTHISELVAGAIDVVRGLAADKGVAVTLTDAFGASGLRALVSANHISHAIHNVIHNAVKYSFSSAAGAETRTVDIELRSHQESYWMLTVMNYGIPIEPDELRRITEKEFRGRHAKDRNRSGAGLGLFFTDTIVRRHGGNLSISSRLLHSAAAITTVTMYLPLYPILRSE